MTPKHRFNVRPEPRHRKKVNHPAVLATSPTAVITLPQTGVLKAAGVVPPVYDQGSEGSCTSNAWAQGLRTVRNIQKLGPFEPSRQFIYAHERMLDGDLNQDAGAQVGDGARVLTDIGVCSESTWPYISNNVFQAPSKDADVEASAHKLAAYVTVDCTPEGVAVQLSQGRPVVFAFSVPQSFESSGPGSVGSTGIMSSDTSGPKIGGHCVLAVDYVITSRGVTYTRPWYQKLMHAILGTPLGGGFDGYFWVCNPWGTSWGQDGWFQMPFSVFRQLAFDPFAVCLASA